MRTSQHGLLFHRKNMVLKWDEWNFATHFHGIWWNTRDFTIVSPPTVMILTGLVLSVGRVSGLAWGRGRFCFYYEATVSNLRTVRTMATMWMMTTIRTTRSIWTTSARMMRTNSVPCHSGLKA